jgi:hypothetical protein
VFKINCRHPELGFEAGLRRPEAALPEQVNPRSFPSGSAGEAEYNPSLRRINSWLLLQQISSEKSRSGVSPSSPKPSNRIAQIPAMAARPPSCFRCYLQRNIRHRSPRPGQPWCPLPGHTEGRAYHAIMAILSSPVMLGASAAGSVGDGGVVSMTLQPPQRAHPPQCSDAPLLTIIATILFCDSAFSSAVEVNGRCSPVQCNCTRSSGTLLA